MINPYSVQLLFWTFCVSSKIKLRNKFYGVKLFFEEFIACVVLLSGDDYFGIS